MKIEDKLVASVISGLKALYGQEVPEKMVQMQKTKKEFCRKDKNPLSVNGMSCFTGVPVKGTYQDKTTDFLLSFGCNFCNGFSGD